MSAPDRTRITTAVIPAAGFGTRLRPLTSIVPKEMLPLGKKPAVEYIVEELHAAGICDIIFVVSPQKEGIREYFGDSACGGRVRVRYALQHTQDGLADAVLKAEEAVAGKHFVVALGDTVILSQKQPEPLERLLLAYKSNPAFAAVLVERVPVSLAYMYGMVRPVSSAAGESFEISDLVEKPKVEESPSDYAIGGRYVFGPEIFDSIRRTPRGAGGELQITDSIRMGMMQGGRVWCAPMLDGEKRYDIGNFKVYCEAFAAMCMLDPELAPSVRRAVESITSTLLS